LTVNVLLFREYDLHAEALATHPEWAKRIIIPWNPNETLTWADLAVALTFVMALFLMLGIFLALYWLGRGGESALARGLRWKRNYPPTRFSPFRKSEEGDYRLRSKSL
jgi:hypothetical protein